MIIGSLSFSSIKNDFSYLERIKYYNHSNEVEYYQVNKGSFHGGYLYNKNLPYKSSDYFYLDNKSDILVLVSGSVYNRSDLLNMAGFSNDISTPELLAQLFTVDGPDFVNNLNGDFTIFIYKYSSEEAYLYRDHLGIRPMAWISCPKFLVFSSDIFGLCRAFSEGHQINRDYLLGYFKYIDYRKTPNEKVKKLLPGHYLKCSESGTEIVRYWKPDKIRIDKKLEYEKMLKEIKWLVTDSVRIRCDKRFTASSHVTGGLDSGIISSIACKEYENQRAFRGFSWSPEKYDDGNTEYDERKLILQLCRWTGIEPVFSQMNLDGFINSVNRYYENQGYYSEDSTSDQVKASKSNLVFSGWGGDDFISTAYRGVELDLLRGLNLRVLIRRNPISFPKKFIKRMLRYVIFPTLHLLDKDTKTSFLEDAFYIKKPFKRSDRRAIRNFYFHTSRKQMHLRLLDFYHIQERCESWALNGFRKGIEYRYPLLDKRIVEYMIKVPSELLCKSDNYRPLLRDISEGMLPEEIRGQLDKTDPVCWAYMDELFKGAALLFMEEVKIWKNNPELTFVDFDLLEEDIEKFKKHSESINSGLLFRALIYLKSVHEFTVTYRAS